MLSRRHPPKSFIFVVLVLILLTSALPYPAPRAHAQTTFAVTSSADSGTGTLRDTVEATATTPGPVTITFNLPDGENTINLQTPIVINQTGTLTIEGVSRANTNITSPANVNVFEVETPLTLQNLSLRGSADGALGITHTGGSLVLDNVLLFDFGSTMNPGYAVNSTGGNLTINNTSVQDITSQDGAIFVGGSTQLVSVDQLLLFGNTVTGAQRGGLTIDSTATAGAPIRRSTFYGNTTDAGIAVINGSISMVNSSLVEGNGGGLFVGAGASANLSFTTITANGSYGLNNSGNITVKNTIIDNTCQGTPPALQGRNFINDSCGTQFIVNANNPVRIVQDGPGTYAPAPESPAIDRAEDCTTVEGATVTDDYAGNARPERATCDVGATELDETAIMGGDLVPPAVVPQIREDETLTELPITPIVLTIDTFPVADVTFTLTNTSPMQCELIDIPNGNAVVTTLPVVFNQTNWSTALGGVSFGVRATEDDVQEGDHNCDIVVTFDPSINTDPLYLNTQGATPPPLPITLSITIKDDDLVEEPTIQTNYDAFAVIGEASEGDTARFLTESADSMGAQVVITLSGPPVNPVRVWVTPGDAPPQCEGVRNSEFNSAALDQSNWDTGVTIEIFAVQDGIQENANQQCSVAIDGLRIRADGSRSPTVDTSRILQINPDPPLSLELSTNQLVVTENSSGTLELSLSTPIGTTSPDVYTITFNDPDLCQLRDENGVTLDQIVLNSINQGTVNLQVFVINDTVFNDPAVPRTCVYTLTPTSNNPSTTIGAVTFTVDIRDDDADLPENAQIIVVEGESGRVLTAPENAGASIDLQEQNDSITLGIRLDRPTAGSVSITVRESAFAPDVTPLSDGTDLTPSQCIVRVAGTASTGSVASFFTNNTEEVEVVIEPRDDAIFEGNVNHFCTIAIERRNPNTATDITVLTYTVNISDLADDQFAVNLIQPGAVLDTIGTVTYRYIVTAPLNEQTRFSINSTTPNVCQSRNGDGFDFPSDPASLPTASNQVITLSLAIFDVVIDSPCIVEVNWDPVPSNYPAGYDVLDVNFIVQNPFVDPPSATSTPAEGDTGPTEVASTPGVTTIVTSTPDPNATSTFQGTPIATAIPIPSVSLLPEVQRLPVRTGPYLGATFITIAVRDTPSGEPEFYRVLARNNDENVDVTWFRIVVNGRIGWASGRSLELNNITEEELPVVGSIFDEIDGARDLGVPGVVVRGREVYRRPSTRAGIISFIPEESVVSIIGRTREFPFDDWYHVRFGGQTGWILSDIRLEDPAVLVNPDQVREIVPVR